MHEIKRVALIVLLFTSYDAMAEWIEVAGTYDVRTYIDYNSVRKEADFVRAWEMRSYMKPKADLIPGVAYQSVKYLSTYDCKEERIRMISMIFHSESMGKGEIVWSTHTPGHWIYVSPNSVGKEMLDTVCK